MLKLEFTSAHEQIFQETTIDAERPGPILHDFDVVCQFVGTYGVRAGGKYNLLPIDAIDMLDKRLRRPLSLQLKRPQLRSHPYAILDAIKFDTDHLFEFEFRDQFGRIVRINHLAVEEGPYVDEFPNGELPLQPGQSMTFLFDYGDSWKFDITLEKIDPPKPRMQKPRLLAARGKAPQQYPNW
jgi:hypothetical protein